MIPLYQRISTARAAKGWSQRDLAKKMDVSQQTIAQWESGGMPRGKRHEKLHELLGTALFKPEDRDDHLTLPLRDSFAAKAMQGLLAAGRDAQYGFDDMPRLAKSSYHIADAMLEARQA
jgi:transcriptional regulator with XRE-family HTH domain